VLEDVGAPADAKPAANLRIAGVREDERAPGTVEIQLDGSAEAISGRNLIVEVNGQQRERRALAVRQPPFVERVSLGTLPVGEHRLTVKLDPADDLGADDARYMLLRRVEPKVLVVAADVQGDDARYFGAA